MAGFGVATTEGRGVRSWIRASDIKPVSVPVVKVNLRLGLKEGFKHQWVEGSKAELLFADIGHRSQISHSYKTGAIMGSVGGAVTNLTAQGVVLGISAIGTGAAVLYVLEHLLRR
jgi:hypothetical protein